jgi:hypothetical protein
MGIVRRGHGLPPIPAPPPVAGAFAMTVRREI